MAWFSGWFRGMSGVFTARSRHRFVPGFFTGLVTLGCTAVAQFDETAWTPGPTIMLAHDGEPAPALNVSSMKITVGDWYMKPLYRLTGEVLRVEGLFVFARAGSANDGNLRAVYYRRPAVDDCGEWGAYSWTFAAAPDAVNSLKRTYGIPEVQDTYWEIDDLGSLGPADETPYESGFLSDDPIGTLVNSLDSETRNVVVEALKHDGYAVADIPFESMDLPDAKGWLVNAARFFDQAIGRNLTAEHLRSLAAAHYLPPDRFDPRCEWWYCYYRCPSPSIPCRAETIFGEWQPDGAACECRTEGPWSVSCGRFVADARGKITIHIPYPPPLGTKLELSVGLGVTIDLCVCVWQRTCMANSKRTVVSIGEDCTRTVTTEFGPRMAFTTYGWTTAYPATECGNAGRPPHLPPGTQDCGLCIPTPDRPCSSP
jgi:hypothetical protein